MRHTKNKIFNVRVSTMVLSFVASSCSFKFELTSQRTALENQIMGTYKELDDDLLVTNFEKTSDDRDGRKNDKSTMAPVVARASKNREFNSDDIKELKDNAIIGELSDGAIALLPKNVGGASSASPEQIKLAEALIDEENRDRLIIWKSQISETVKSGEKEEATIRATFARELFEKSPPGHWFNIGNRWTVKP